MPSSKPSPVHLTSDECASDLTRQLSALATSEVGRKYQTPFRQAEVHPCVNGPYKNEFTRHSERHPRTASESEQGISQVNAPVRPQTYKGQRIKTTAGDAKGHGAPHTPASRICRIFCFGKLQAMGGASDQIERRSNSSASASIRSPVKLNFEAADGLLVASHAKVQPGGIHDLIVAWMSLPGSMVQVGMGGGEAGGTASPSMPGSCSTAATEDRGAGGKSHTATMAAPSVTNRTDC